MKYEAIYHLEIYYNFNCVHYGFFCFKWKFKYSSSYKKPDKYFQQWILDSYKSTSTSGSDSDSDSDGSGSSDDDGGGSDSGDGFSGGDGGDGGDGGGE